MFHLTSANEDLQYCHFTELNSHSILMSLQLVMLLWSYFSVVFTDPGGVPPNWRPAVDEERGDNDPLTIPEFPADSENGRVRFCRKCNQLKPPRCHHCSVCESVLACLDCWNFVMFLLRPMSNWITSLGGRCVLKMDHHCVWVVNCVGALNYKYFLLFLV